MMPLNTNVENPHGITVGGFLDVRGGLYGPVRTRSRRIPLTLVEGETVLPSPVMYPSRIAALTCSRDRPSPLPENLVQRGVSGRRISSSPSSPPPAV